MLAIDRLKRIEELLIENGSVIVSNLSNWFEVSEETIRRDLEKLEKEKKLKRVRGGAYLPNSTDSEVPIRIRESIYLEEKQLIGQKCVELVENGDTIMLDSSTTALHVCKNLKQSKMKITVISNSLRIANELEGNKSIKVICLGGTLRSNTSSFVGYMTTDTLQKLAADKAFISCSSINADFGVTDKHEYEAAVRKIMLKNSVKKYMIVDYTKFDSPSRNKICDICELDMIITDKKVSKKYMDILKENKVELVCCK